MQSIKTSTLMILGLSILFYLFFDFSKHTPALGTANPSAEDPFDAVGSFGIQLTFVSALLALIRAFRPYPPGGIPATQLRLVLRSWAIALLSVAVTLVADAIGLARAILTSGVLPAAAPLVVLLGGMTILTLAAGQMFVRKTLEQGIPSQPRFWTQAGIVSVLATLILAFYPLAWRDSGVPGGILTALTGMMLLFFTVWGIATAIFPGTELGFEDIISDLFTILRGAVNHFRHAAVLLSWIARVTAFPPLSRFLDLLNLRKHRWNLVILTGVTMGLLLVMVEMIAEGMSPYPVRVLVVSVYVGLEGAGVALGYLLLGKYLGISTG